MPEGFSDKMEKFCNEYLVDLNGTQAAIRAGYSQDTACVIASENLRKPSIQSRISELRLSTGKSFNITRERIAQEYARIAFFDVRKIHTDDGSLKPVTEFGDDEAAVIAGIEVTDNWEKDEEGNAFVSGQLKKVKVTDKRGALDSLVKLMGYAAPDKHEHTGADGTALIPVITINPIQTVAAPITESESDELQHEA